MYTLYPTRNPVEKTMKLWIALAVYLSAVLLLCLVSGCQTADYQQAGYTGQGLTATYSTTPAPGYVVATREDGSQTVTPLLPSSEPLPPSKGKVAPTPAAPPVLQTPAAKSPVVFTKIVPPAPAVTASYKLTPEVIKKGDGFTASRVMTWAGEAPGTAAEKVATQKDKVTHNPMPAVTLDAKGVHVGSGGGSTDDQAGQSWFQRMWTAGSDVLKGWGMWLLVIGIGVAAFFILPILFPVLAPLFASITAGVEKAWTYITGEIGKLIAWLKTIHLKKSVPPVGSTTNPSVPAGPAVGAAISVPPTISPSPVSPSPAPVLSVPVDAATPTAPVVPVPMPEAGSGNPTVAASSAPVYGKVAKPPTPAV
jgi:hypothetical protein